ncbi:MAG: SDR family NAD(P)-dependent oxidoreductase, partial [Chloroflexota bacterium]|nr:SDR family NAD(P)-dependent oxidoreductase [Chloroflexota bacterium]
MARHDGRVAIVTGAGSGIGRAIALRLAADGATVACADINTTGAGETASQIGQAGGQSGAFAVDVADEASVNSLREAVEDAFGQADILCCIAGIILRESLDVQSVEAWNRVLAVNLTGMFLCAKAFIPAMRKRGWGRVVNMGSTSG